MQKDQWTTYWRDGTATSFGHQSPAWYERTIIPFWQQTFQLLPRGADILDVASGNGAVAAIAAEVGAEQGKSFHIAATDKAGIAPDLEQHPQLESVEFMPNMSLETLRLPDRAFDLACSQFGIEYSRMDQALGSISNLLKPEGKLVMVAHNTESVICNGSREELQQYREILKQQQLFKRLRDLVKAMGEIRSRSDLQRLAQNPRSEKGRKAFNRLVDKLMKKFPEGVVVADALSQINPLFKERVVSPLAAKLAYIDAVEQSFLMGQQRLIDLINAALDDKDVARMQSVAERSGLLASGVEKMEDQEVGLLAWILRFKR